jgi:hypothetical protein
VEEFPHPGAPVLFGRMAWSGDGLWLRDARGRSGRPALVPERPLAGIDRLLRARGSFSLVQRFQVKPEEGAVFVRATRDENPIHTEGEVVPGAMVAARALLLPEMLLSGSRVERARLRFRAPAYYRFPTVNLYRLELSGPGAVRVHLQVRQRGQEVADGQLQLSLDRPAWPLGAEGERLSEPGSSRRRPEAELEGEPETSRIRSFLASVGLHPELYLKGSGPLYPRAFLAALPSGEMVRQFSGEGGLLNALELEFPEHMPILGTSGLPTVELKDSARSRKSFRKVLARIAEGVRTFCSGFAMVLPSEAAPTLSSSGTPSSITGLR